MKIYLDMDGVLCDFLGGISNLLGVPIGSKTKWVTIREEAWDAVATQGWSFWRDLEWLAGGKDLFEGVLEVSTPTILSACTSRKNIQGDAKVGKRLWLSREVGFQYADAGKFVKAIDKQLYSSTDAILIDDSRKNIEQWKARGGIGILHKGDTAATLDKLLEVIYENT